MKPAATRPPLIVLAVLLAMLGLAAMVLAGYFGDRSSYLDAFSHFRVHFALGAAILALPLLASRFRLTALTVLVFCGACLATSPATMLGLAPVQAGAAPGMDGSAVYRLLQMNLRFDNKTPEKVLSLVGSTQPDIITFEESSPMWEEKLALLEHAYPYRIACGSVFGTTILSRRPFAEGGEPRCFGHGALALARVDLGGTVIDVGAIHLGWPWPRVQVRQIERLAEPLASLGADAIAAGDCNAATWSAAVRRLAAQGGLTVLPSVGPTWMWRRMPDWLRFAGLPIDQVFSKGGVVIRSAQALGPAGSDHLPILVEFTLAPKAPQEENKTAAAGRSGSGAAG